MKTPSRILALILTFVLMMGASGCIFQSNKSKMLAHLREKYNGQEFVPIRMESGGSWFHTSTAILYCYPKGGDPEADKVSATMDLDTKEFSDASTIKALLEKPEFRGNVTVGKVFRVLQAFVENDESVTEVAKRFDLDERMVSLLKMCVK